MIRKIALGFACFGVVVGIGVWVMAARLRPGVELQAALPNVEFTDQQGNPVAAADFRGKVVLLDFWQST